LKPALLFSRLGEAEGNGPEISVTISPCPEEDHGKSSLFLFSPLLDRGGIASFLVLPQQVFFQKRNGLPLQKISSLLNRGASRAFFAAFSRALGDWV